MGLSQVSGSDSAHSREEMAEQNAVDQVLERAAQVVGVRTKELGVAVGPTLDEALLERLELLQAVSDRLLLVLTLKSGLVRTIFVEVPARMAPEIVVQVAVVLNERLAGLTLREIRAALSERLRDAAPDAGSSELLNIFIQEADDLFDVQATGAVGGGVVLGSAQLLAGQPEFATKERLQGLLEVTERRDVLREALAKRLGQGLTITIGSEHQDATLAPFTLVTAAYRLGPPRRGVGGVGPKLVPLG